jgi:hypothetical protein
MQVYQATNIWSRAGVSRSALLLLRFLSLTAGTQSRTDDNALRPALHEAGSCVVSKENRSRDSTIRRLSKHPAACRLREASYWHALRSERDRGLRVDRSSISGALRYLPLRSCSHRFGALSAGYTLAAFGGSLRDNL